MNYRLIVIDASLTDKSIFTKYPILTQTKFEAGTPDESLMYKILIPEDKVSEVSNFLKDNLKTPYYSHLYHEDPDNDTLIVIFSGQIFQTSKTNPENAVEYGIQHGVTEKQMIIKPLNVLEEKW